jgi:hypothetical protein
MLEQFKMQNTSAYDIIQPGLDKLEEYEAIIAENQTYIIATCKFLVSLIELF